MDNYQVPNPLYSSWKKAELPCPNSLVALLESTEVKKKREMMIVLCFKSMTKFSLCSKQPKLHLSDWLESFETVGLIKDALGLFHMAIWLKTNNLSIHLQPFFCYCCFFTLYHQCVRSFARLNKPTSLHLRGRKATSKEGWENGCCCFFKCQFIYLQ